MKRTRIFYDEHHGRREPLFLVAAGVCLLFGLIPLAIYGILHSGVVVLLLGGAIFFVLGVLWRQIHAVLRHLILAVLCLGLGAALALSILMARQAYFTAPPDGAELPVIVLGGKVNGDRPSLMLSRRLGAAAEYLKLHPKAVCVVSGGQGADEEYPEAQVMAAYLMELGIEGERIFEESASTNTQENLAFSQVILREQLGSAEEAAVATDGFHQLRAALYASYVGMDAYALPASTPWGLAPAYWVREWMGLPVAWLKGNEYIR